jgi:hypothetical protein
MAFSEDDMRKAMTLAGLGLAALTAGCGQGSQYPTYGYGSGYPGYAYNAGYPAYGYSTSYPSYGYNAGYAGNPVGPAVPPGTRVSTTDGSGQIVSNGTYYGPGVIVPDNR